MSIDEFCAFFDTPRTLLNFIDVGCDVVFVVICSNINSGAHTHTHHRVSKLLKVFTSNFQSFFK